MDEGSQPRHAPATPAMDANEILPRTGPYRSRQRKGDGPKDAKRHVRGTDPSKTILASTGPKGLAHIHEAHANEVPSSIARTRSRSWNARTRQSNGREIGGFAPRVPPRRRPDVGKPTHRSPFRQTHPRGGRSREKPGLVLGVSYPWGKAVVLSVSVFSTSRCVLLRNAQGHASHRVDVTSTSKKEGARENDKEKASMRRTSRLGAWTTDVGFPSTRLQWTQGTLHTHGTIVNDDRGHNTTKKSFHSSAPVGCVQSAGIHIRHPPPEKVWVLHHVRCVV